MKDTGPTDKIPNYVAKLALETLIMYMEQNYIHVDKRDGPTITIDGSGTVTLRDQKGKVLNHLDISRMFTNYPWADGNPAPPDPTPKSLATTEFRPWRRCETCQKEGTIRIDCVDWHFCESCLKKIDARIAQINSKWVDVAYKAHLDKS